MATVETENRNDIVEANDVYAAASRRKNLGNLERFPRKQYLIGTYPSAAPLIFSATLIPSGNQRADLYAPLVQ